ncbi:lipopolysaccharide assembly protein LapA domain-containing protein [Klenkia sp. LSe6-5]|uniref:Lipopolysaccharide assembly protein LapA domain-containing protein n=1 Tax=Klenkia sesuvii TaxID=3103137 RepID=A0ABU8DZ83_9ACTN
MTSSHPVGDPTPPPAAPPGTKRRGSSVGRTLNGVLLVVVTVVLVLFVVFNTQTVRVSLVFGVVDLPLVVALLAAAVLGALIVALLSIRARRRGR